MKTKTIGELLAGERQKRQLSIAEVAAATKIQPNFLTALENNNFELLPSATFVKGYIKSLADLYRVDPQPLLATLRRDFKESAVGRLVPRDFLKPVLKKRPLWTPLTVTFVGLATVFVTLLSYVGLQWYSLQKPPELILSQPTENADVPSLVKVVGQTRPDVVVAVNSQPVSLFPDGRFETEILLPKDGTHILTVEAVDRRGKKRVIQRLIRVSE